ncbi:hypothetical protein C0J52_28005, partial [Blattella germanica]
SVANPLYCANCQSADHYTGQVKCPAYPRATAPPSEPRYIPLAQKQPAQSPPKPSRQDFPPLTQNAWAKPLIHEASTETTNNQTPTQHQETTTTPQSENISPPPPTPTAISQAMKEAMKETMVHMESYIDRKISLLQDQLIKFTIRVVNSIITPYTKPNFKTSVNSTSKKLFNKRIQILPLHNQLQVLIDTMKRDLHTELALHTNATHTQVEASPATHE